MDDDRDVRRSISFVLGSIGIASYPFPSGADFLEALNDLHPGCILLDLRMPQVDGFQVMEELRLRGVDWPVIVMTGHGEIPVAVRAMKLGAIDFLEKPFSEESLTACFSTAFDLLEVRTKARERARQARERMSLLTARETEVLKYLLGGYANKAIARHLGISLRTVEMHRGNMMDRLQVDCLAAALALAIDAGLDPMREAA